MRPQCPEVILPHVEAIALSRPFSCLYRHMSDGFPVLLSVRTSEFRKLGRLCVLYTFCLRYNGFDWSLTRRFSDIKSMQSSVRRFLASRRLPVLNTPRLRSSWCGGLSPDRLQQRRIWVQRVVREVAASHASWGAWRASLQLPPTCHLCFTAVAV